MLLQKSVAFCFFTLAMNEFEKLNNPEWKKWGPYLAERQWGTVREDYSEFGSAWEFFPHDHARSRTYRWGEDGLAGFCDDKQLVCLAFAFWNGKDDILKERLFGLTGNEGNHNEDVKELYYYLENSPTHSYQTYLYKYPQNTFPYADLVAKNAARTKNEPEYELADTGVFDKSEYFDIYVTYAKTSPEQLLVKVTVKNHSAEKAVLHILPTLWFRNTWSWNPINYAKPQLHQEGDSISAIHPLVGEYIFIPHKKYPTYYTENETNATRLFGLPSLAPYVKDAFHEYLIQGRKEAVNELQHGTKAAFHVHDTWQAGEEKSFYFILSEKNLPIPNASQWEGLINENYYSANAFYQKVLEPLEDAHGKVAKHALAGLLWGKQYYEFNVNQWLQGDVHQTAPPEMRKTGRNHQWKHLYNHDIISMPDKWEYPWYAAWDLAFHAIPFTHADADFAKHQMELFLSHRYLSPKNQLPAYEWAFGDVNPPVHAYGIWNIFLIDFQKTGKKDLDFLQRVYLPLTRNFQWWLQTQTKGGKFLFGGGFLGLDNIGVIDRGAALAEGAWLEQMDGTCWMALFSLNMMKISLELADKNPEYEAEALYYAQIFLNIAHDVNDPVNGCWNPKDGFYNDVICYPDGRRVYMNVRNIVDLMALYPIECIKNDAFQKMQTFSRGLQQLLAQRPALTAFMSKNNSGDYFFTMVSHERFSSLYEAMCDETKFLSPHGIRSLSKEYGTHPYEITISNQKYALKYQPAESDTLQFGENSNWRGPVWFPVNYVLIDALNKFNEYYGNERKWHFPSFPQGELCSLKQVAKQLTLRLASLFIDDSSGIKPVYNSHHKVFKQPDFNQHLLFYEYFNGDNGNGCGASHQTGWTALIADLLLKYANKQAP